MRVIWFSTVNNIYVLNIRYVYDFTMTLHVIALYLYIILGGPNLKAGGVVTV